MASSVKLLTNLLDYCVEKNRVISKNIANIGTENYKRQDVSFRDILSENVSSMMNTTNPKHIKAVDPENSAESKFQTVYDESENMISGANNINIEREMSELAENTLRFKFASKKVGDYYRSMQNVIKGGGRG
jgi:flagellar basal-body rod protein FlgB